MSVSQVAERLERGGLGAGKGTRLTTSAAVSPSRYGARTAMTRGDSGRHIDDDDDDHRRSAVRGYSPSW